MKRSLIWLTWLMRLLTGATFIFSGFVKAIDPWGTLYKFEDYMGALHLPVYTNLLLVAAFLLCAYEFCIGIFLISGSFRRSAPIGGAVLMAVMLPLTLWIAISDPVADCGCFGDAVVLSNWATFWKNVVLTLAFVWLIRYNAKVRWIIRPHLQWMGLLASAAYVTLIGLGGYTYQPLIDFRPYPKGSTLVDSDSDNAEENEEITLIYSRDGKEQSFSIDDELPSEDDGWTFVRREVKPSPVTTADADRSEHSAEKTFRIWSDDGEEDVTDNVMLSEGRQLLIFMPDLKNVSVATTWQINSLYSWAQANDIDMIGIVSGTLQDITELRDISLAAYPIYTAEDTEIKMVVRGNPAVVYLENGEVIWKTTLRALDTEDFLSDEARRRDPASYARNDHALLYNVSLLYVIVMAALVGLSYIPKIVRMFPDKWVSRGDRGVRSESTPHDTPAQ